MPLTKLRDHASASSSACHAGAPHAGSEHSVGRKVDGQADVISLKHIAVPPVNTEGTSTKSVGDAEAAQWTPRSCKAFRSSEGMPELRVLIA